MHDGDPGWDERATRFGKVYLVIAGVWGLLVLATIMAAGDFRRELVAIASASYVLPLGALLIAGIMLMRRDPQVLHRITRYLWVSYVTGLLGSVVFSFFGVIVTFVAGIGEASLTPYYWRLMQITIGANILFILAFPVLIMATE